MQSLNRQLEDWLAEQGLADVHIEPPPNSSWGDYSTAWPLKVAKEAKKSPFEVATELEQQLSRTQPAWLKRIEVTKPGYLNFFFTTEALVSQAFADLPKRWQKRSDGKIVVEHTSVNPNKAAHIGHVRNAVLGDTLARLLIVTGHEVEVQNYIDDTGLQVADVVFASSFLQTEPPSDVAIDTWAWDIYAAIQTPLQENDGLRHQRNEILHLIEQRDATWAKKAAELVDQIVEAHLKTFARLGIGYDALIFESSIIEAGLWQKTFALLKQKKAIEQSTSGPNAGAWIIPFGGTTTLANGEEKSLDKILVKSNGSLTYLAKDLAYQLGPPKFGQVHADLKYRKTTQPADPKRPLWRTDHGTTEVPVGQASETITLIDQRQSYLRDVLREALKELGFPQLAERDIHFAYEVVSLSPAAAKSLGLEVEADQRSVTMSGRKGIGIKANDLIDAAGKVILDRQSDQTIAALLARAAVRYAMLKLNPLTEIIFDLETATRPTGDSGVYLCYAVTRARSLLRQAGQIETNYPAYTEPLEPSERKLLNLMSSRQNVIQTSALELNPSLLAHYAFELATAFTAFYEDPLIGPIVTSQDSPTKQFRLQLVRQFERVMTETLELLGIVAPDKM